MNILQVGSYLYPDLVGGAEISAQNVYTILTEAGHNVVRLRSGVGSFSTKTRLTKASKGEWKADSWRPFSPIEQRNIVLKSAYYVMEFATVVDRDGFKNIISEENIDAIIVHSFRGIGYDILNAISEANLPTFFFLHDFALICLNKCMVRSGVICEAPCLPCRAVGAKTRIALGRMDKVILVGPSKQIARRVQAELALSRLTTAHLPNPNSYNLVPRLRRKTTTPLVLGYVGRLDREKGLVELLPVIDDLARTHPIRFIIAGKGGLEAEVVQFSKDRPWVDYLGYVNPAQTPAVFDSIDILVMPSLWPENFPGVAVQAIISGSPVFAFDIGGIPEIVQDGISGRLLPYGDFGALGTTLAEIMDDNDLLNRYSSGALKSGEQFNADLLAARLLTLIEEHTGLHGHAA